MCASLSSLFLLSLLCSSRIPPSLTNVLYTRMFEGEHAPPYYLDLYGFADGAQEATSDGSALPGPTRRVCRRGLRRAERTWRR